MGLFSTSFVKQRLREPSTWAGVAVALGMGSQAVASKDPTAIGAVIGGLLAMFMPDPAASQVSQAKPAARPDPR